MAKPRVRTASPSARPQIHLLAGVNGAGKSSIGGASIRHAGAHYFNPDEAARRLIEANPGLPQRDANAAAWEEGRRLLERAIRERLDFAFETTLGANTMTQMLLQAADAGFDIHAWYAGLTSPELHLSRVKARVKIGGHDIPETDIRRRYQSSRMNLIRLLPHLASLRMYDNSMEADPAKGIAPLPRLLLHMERGAIRGPDDLGATPDWVKPVVAAALKFSMPQHS
ncbi:MAG: zeta toxin family protein [Betaproteobacteria bacterium]